MTPYEKKQINLHIKQTKALVLELKKYFKKAGNAAEKAINDNGVKYFEDNLDKYLFFDEYANIIYNSWGQTGAKFAKITEYDIKNQYHINKKSIEPAKLNIGFFSQTYVDNMTRYAKATGGNLIKDVDETTRKSIKDALVKAGEQRLGTKETARLIKKASGFSTARALTIARTETTAAAEAGSYIVAQSWNMPMTSTWVCMFKNSRVSHINAHGQVVKLGDNFDIGGFKMKSPGDNLQGAPAAEIVNCKCTTYYKVANPPEPDTILPAYKPAEREFQFSHLISTLIESSLRESVATELVLVESGA